MPRGPKPKPPGAALNRSRVHEWNPAPGEGWQHGDPEDPTGVLPAPPVGLMPQTTEAWGGWFRSWWAAFWEPADLPMIQLIAQLYDGVVRDGKGMEKLTPLLDRYGMTPKGRQDLRWTRAPVKAEPASDGDQLPQVDLDAMTKKQLLKLAADRDIKVNARAKVADLRTELAQHVEPVDEVTARRLAREQRLA